MKKKKNKNKNTRKISCEIHNQPIRKAKHCENTPFVQSETRTLVLHSGGQQECGFLKKKMEEKLPRFALLEGTIDDFIGKQENKNTRAKTDRDVSLLKIYTIFLMRFRIGYF